MKKSDILREKIRKNLRIIHWVVIMLTFVWAFATKQSEEVDQTPQRVELSNLRN
jgi:hypothetical protein